MVIGVTGGFGVGKSTFCTFLKKFGVEIIDADYLTHQLYEPGQLGFEKIRGYFGEEFVSGKTGVKRSKLRSVVLKNPQKLWILNTLIHPLLRNEMIKKIRKIQKEKGKYVLIAIESLYFEKDDPHTWMDRLILIERKPTFIKFNRQHQWRLADIDRFMKLQPMFPKADIRLENNGTLDELKQKAHEIFQELQ